MPSRRLLLRCALAAAVLAPPLPAAAGGLPSFPEADYRRDPPAEIRLGRDLFYDPILSGNRNIACATCHHPNFATSDGVSLGLGEGGRGLGPDRRPDPEDLPEERIPRNAPALFNLGAAQFGVMFHDGRVEADPRRPSGFRTPMGDEMSAGFDGVLSAQSMFPVLSQDEMAGHYSENEIAQAVRRGRITGEGGAWALLARRLAVIPEYRESFAAAYPEIAAGRPIAFSDAANAVAAFVAFEWRADDAPFDRALRGGAPLPAKAAEGAALFYGEAGCATCHAGRFQTDHGFHAMGVPQFGPGKKARFERHARDVGRMRVTGRAEDAHRFRTPSLRNVTRTGPWGHDGAYATLRGFVEAHLDPAAAAERWDRTQAILPSLEGAEDWLAADDAQERAAIAAAAEWRGPDLDPERIDALMAFLDALTDERSLAGRLGIPETVPSGLEVER